MGNFYIYPVSATGSQSSNRTVCAVITLQYNKTNILTVAGAHIGDPRRICDSRLSK